MARLKKKVTMGTRPTTDHQDLVVVASAFHAKPGEYHVVELGQDGEEISGSDFSIADGRTFKKTYKNNPRYLIKKKNS